MPYVRDCTERTRSDLPNGLAQVSVDQGLSESNGAGSHSAFVLEYTRVCGSGDGECRGWMEHGGRSRTLKCGVRDSERDSIRARTLRKNAPWKIAPGCK